MWIDKTFAKSWTGYQSSPVTRTRTAGCGPSLQSHVEFPQVAGGESSGWLREASLRFELTLDHLRL